MDTSTGDPTSWHWDFGDGVSSTSENPSHVYLSVGSYQATLMIGNGSDVNTTSHMITVDAANVIAAASAAFTDVSVAVSAAGYGDTVVVPAGNATWTGTITLTKGISIIGAGKGSTNITCNQNYTFRFSPDSTTRVRQDLFRISGFTFKGSSGYCTIGLTESNSETIPNRKIRIDHCRFEKTAGYPVYVDGNFWGVVDSCEFPAACFFMLEGNQNNSWRTFYPAQFGTADNLYFEDNVFSGHAPDGIGGFAIESGQGGRWCFRYNTSTCDYMPNPMFDQHGFQSYSTGVYGLMLCEIYENQFSGLTNGVARWEYCRGGKLLMFNNVGQSSTGSPNITFHDARSEPTPNDPYIYTPYDCYVWNNLWNGKRVNATEGTDYYGTIQEDATFWNQKDNFDGSSGLGVGPFSSRPTSCTKEGVGWWATDEMKLYRWHNGAWEIFYTPYTYPHPLRAGR
jgi:PKD repeat protein